MPPDCARRKLCAVFLYQIVRRAQIVCSAQIVRRAETEPPNTMMLSHFSGGNTVYGMEYMHKIVKLNELNIFCEFFYYFIAN